MEMRKVLGCWTSILYFRQAHLQAAAWKNFIACFNIIVHVGVLTGTETKKNHFSGMRKVALH